MMHQCSTGAAPVMHGCSIGAMTVAHAASAVQREPPVARATYLDLIDEDRRAQHEEAAAPANRSRAPEPPKAKPGYARKRQLDRDLARTYERCKSQTRGRFRSTQRQRGYCAAVAWTVAKKSGRYPDYPAFRGKEEDMKRDSRGRFLPKSHSRSTRRSSGRSSES